MRAVHLPLVFVLACWSTDCVTAGEPLKQTPTADLLRRLDSPKFRERDEAHQELLTRDGASAEIRRALPTLGAEGRKRASLILDVMMKRRSERFLQYGREGRVDLLVEWSAVAGKQIDPEPFWQCVLDVAWERVRRSQPKDKIDEFTKRFPAQTYAKFLSDRSPLTNDFDTIETAIFPDHIATRCDGITSNKILRACVIVSSGKVKLSNWVDRSIVFAAADIDIKMADSSILIADGNVRVGHSMHGGCTIFARGSVDRGFDMRRYQELMIDEIKRDSKKAQREPEMYDLLYRPGQPARRIYLPGPVEDPDDSAAVANVVEPVRIQEPPSRDDGIRFFELNDIGVKLKAEGGKLRFESLQIGSPLAKAGVKPGDVVDAVDDILAGTPDAMRRSLRRAFVIGGCEITVYRGHKLLRLPVSFFRMGAAARKKAGEVAPPSGRLCR